PNQPSSQRAVAIDMPQAGQAAVVVAVPLPPPGPERAVAVVTNAVLGGGFSSRLNQEIRIRRGLSYGADSGLDLRPGGGSLRAVVQTKNESAAEVVRLVQAELDRLATDAVEPTELDARKATLIGEVSRSVETTAGLAGSVASLVVDGRPLSELRTRIDALNAVDSGAVLRYAAQHFDAAGRHVVVAGQTTRFAEALRSAAADLVIIPAGRLDLDGAGPATP
ncbi:MAG: insulinase family protein, partial [Pseudomonadota bacterium]|nr:insulinase family protein [Pseudomonadota bacterium]